jgi:SSS family solute:Na+ symporter
LAYGFAQLELNLIAVLSVAASSGLAVMVPAIIGAFYWRRDTPAGVLVSVIGAEVTGVVGHSYPASTEK